MRRAGGGIGHRLPTVILILFFHVHWTRSVLFYTHSTHIVPNYIWHEPFGRCWSWQNYCGTTFPTMRDGGTFSKNRNAIEARSTMAYVPFMLVGSQ